jgi:hypothetical protein
MTQCVVYTFSDANTAVTLRSDLFVLSQYHIQLASYLLPIGFRAREANFYGSVVKSLELRFSAP